ncbi:MAG: 30S ribosomal protein S10 [Minisyncoccia bacterium]
MKNEQSQKIRIKIRSYDPKLIESSVKYIVEAIRKHGGDVIGPIPLPTDIRRYQPNRSTFIYKKSREEFELKTHKRLIDIVNPNKNIIETLNDLNLPAGIDVEIKVM